MGGVLIGNKCSAFFPLYLNKLLGSKYWITEVYAHKLWHVTDGAVTNFFGINIKTKEYFNLC